MEEYRISLDELSFTNVCKRGFLTKQLTSGTTQINLTKMDILELSKGGILEKKYSDCSVLMMIERVDYDTIKEIVKRSPVFSDLYDSM